MALMRRRDGVTYDGLAGLKEVRLQVFGETQGGVGRLGLGVARWIVA